MPTVTRDLFLDLLDRIHKAAAEIAPTAPIEVRIHDGLVMGMFWRARSLFEGTKILLEHDLADEAMILARSIFEESMRIGQIRLEGVERAAMAMWWMNRSLRDRIGLMKEAQRVGFEEDASGTIRSLEIQKEKLQGYMARNGITRLKKPLSEKEASHRLDRAKDYWSFQYAHEFVHGSDTAYLYRRQKLENDIYGMFAKNGDIGIALGVAQFAGKALLLAGIDTVEMFGRGSKERFQALIDELDALEPPPKSATNATHREPELATNEYRPKEKREALPSLSLLREWRDSGETSQR